MSFVSIERRWSFYVAARREADEIISILSAVHQSLNIIIPIPPPLLHHALTRKLSHWRKAEQERSVTIWLREGIQPSTVETDIDEEKQKENPADRHITSITVERPNKSGQESRNVLLLISKQHLEHLHVLYFVKHTQEVRAEVKKVKAQLYKTVARQHIASERRKKDWS